MPIKALKWYAYRATKHEKYMLRDVLPDPDDILSNPMLGKALGLKHTASIKPKKKENNQVPKNKFKSIQ